MVPLGVQLESLSLALQSQLQGGRRAFKIRAGADLPTKFSSLPTRRRLRRLDPGYHTTASPSTHPDI